MSLYTQELPTHKGFTDLTNQVFNELTVLHYVGHAAWRCICSCGKRTVVRSKHLKSNHIRSCGHLKVIPKSKFHDITNQTFQYLTVLKHTRNDKGQTKWICLCQCGKEKIMTYSRLISNKMNSCGCAKYLSKKGKPFNTTAIDLTNQIFTKLKVLNRHGYKGRSITWKCKCKCNRIVIVEGRNLRNLKTKSCKECKKLLKKM